MTIPGNFESENVETNSLRTEEDSGTLQVESLKLCFGSNTVLEDISFELPFGETFVILGESGCGKTSLLRVVAGLQMEYSGTIRLGGNVLDGRPGPHSGIVYMDQDAVMFDHLDLFENVAFALRIAGVPHLEIKHRVAEILQAVELTEHVKKRSWQLSGGQKQRVAFARAILSQPRVLLLDEPFCSLDGRNRRSMQELFIALSRHYRITSIFVTHDLKEAMIVGDRFAFMSNGKVRVYRSRQDFMHDEATGIPSERMFWKQTE